MCGSPQGNDQEGDPVARPSHYHNKPLYWLPDETWSHAAAVLQFYLKNIHNERMNFIMNHFFHQSREKHSNLFLHEILALNSPKIWDRSQLIQQMLGQTLSTLLSTDICNTSRVGSTSILPTSGDQITKLKKQNLSAKWQ
jgi:hypothetical protein